MIEDAQKIISQAKEEYELFEGSFHFILFLKI